MKEDIRRYRGERTQKEYSEFLHIDIRTVQNWESRGAGRTTEQLLEIIYLLEKDNRLLKKRLKDKQLTFQLQ